MIDLRKEADQAIEKKHDLEFEVRKKEAVIKMQQGQIAMLLATLQVGDVPNEESQFAQLNEE